MGRAWCIVRMISQSEGDRCIIIVLLPFMTWLCLWVWERKRGLTCRSEGDLSFPDLCSSYLTQTRSHLRERASVASFSWVKLVADFSLTNWVVEDKLHECVVCELQISKWITKDRLRNLTSDCRTLPVCLFLNAHIKILSHTCTHTWVCTPSISRSSALLLLCGPNKVDLFLVFSFSTFNANHGLPRFCQDTPTQHTRAHRVGLTCCILALDS